MKSALTVACIVLGVALVLTADVYLKKSGLTNSRLLLVGVGLYALAALPVAYIFTTTQFGTVFIVWEATTVLAAMVVAYVFFGEALTVSRSVSLVLALAALVVNSLN